MPKRCIDLVCAALLLAGVGALTPRGAVAQVPDMKLIYLPLDSATVVRLHFLRGERVAGRLLAPFGPDSTTLVYCQVKRSTCLSSAGENRHAAPAAELTRIDIRRGTRSTEGAIAGALILIGGAATFCALTDTRGCDPSHGGFLSYVVLPTALVGAGIGAILGGGVSRWEQAP